MILTAIEAAAREELSGLFNSDTADKLAKAIAKNAEPRVVEAVVKILQTGAKKPKAKLARQPRGTKAKQDKTKKQAKAQPEDASAPENGANSPAEAVTLPASASPPDATSIL